VRNKQRQNIYCSYLFFLAEYNAFNTRKKLVKAVIVDGSSNAGV